ncbi:hypothetical protein SCHPADRAFT_920029 [Schizopora paradoxa]|uniref:Translation initiation factor eIF2B subunit gamma n=1 Tax=Schizopora paradoxa TaxID=27342 RepID=A0A0H2RVK0_9AGAM|nr:hypothetical protein SCHPADRAFT_920029 [Schizopora paradoxa]
MMNIGETPAVQVPKEFLAVILAGVGDDLFPIVGEYRGGPCPKALLPIANRPMLSYVLNWIEDSSIRDVLIVCPPSHRDAISNYLDSEASSLSIGVHSFDQASSKGTCTSLRQISPQLAQYNCDIVLLPCDIVPPPSLKLESVLNRFRVDRSTDGTLLTSLFMEYRPPEKEKGASGDDAWAPPELPMPIVYDSNSNTLLHIDTLDAKGSNDEEFDIRMGMLWKYPRVRLSRNFVDAHVYVLARPALDLVNQKPMFHSFRDEFIPWLCKVQYQRTKREKYGGVLKSDANTRTYSSALALQHSSTFAPSTAKENHRGTDTPDPTASQPPSPTPDLDEAFPQEPSLRCGLVIHRASSGFAARAHNLWNFMELNRELNRVLLPTRPPPDRALVDPTSSTGDSLIGESTKIGEKSSVRRSIIGKHCTIGKYVTISNSVILDHCIIDDRAKLEGCILGYNTHVGEKSELVRCATQAGYEVEAEDSIKQAKLETSNWTADPPREGDAETSDEEDEDESEDEDEEEEGEEGEEEDDEDEDEDSS